MTDLIPRPKVLDPAPGSFEFTPRAAVSGPADLADAVRLALAVLDLGPGDHGDHTDIARAGAARAGLRRRTRPRSASSLI